MVTVNSGQLPTARGVEEGYDLALVIGKWQAISSGRFRNDCRDLLQMIEETDELRLWEKNVGGFTYDSRDEFLKRKVLIDYDLTENALKDIVGKLKHGEDANLSKFARIESSKELKAAGVPVPEIAKKHGTCVKTVYNDLCNNGVMTDKLHKAERVRITYQISNYTNPETAAGKIREKFGDEFADDLKLVL